MITVGFLSTLKSYSIQVRLSTQWIDLGKYCFFESAIKKVNKDLSCNIWTSAEAIPFLSQLLC